MQENKVNFFKRCKIAIFDFDQYARFLLEKPSTAVKFLLILILLVGVIVSAFMTYGFSGYVDKGFQFFFEQIPNFTYQDEHLSAESMVEGYDEEYDFRLILDTNEISEEQMNQYKERIESSGLGVIFLSDKILLKQDTIQEITYPDFIKTYGNKIPETFTKQDVENLLRENFNKPTILGTIFAGTFPIFFFTNLITVISDVILVSLVGLIASRIAKIALKYVSVVSLAIYSLTLPILLNAIYICVYQLTGFSIKYFNFMYISVAYIYMIAAIFMIRMDIIKQVKELEKEKNNLKEESNQEEIAEETEEKSKEKTENKTSQEKEKTEEPSSKKETEFPESDKKENTSPVPETNVITQQENKDQMNSQT